MEKDLVLEHFPNTRFVRTCKSKSKRHHYYMAEEKDQLRFLSGIDKTQKDFKTGLVNVIVRGCKLTFNVGAIRAYEKLLLNNIKYYSGEIGGMNNAGELLGEEQINKSLGLKQFCGYELSQVRKIYKEILGK